MTRAIEPLRVGFIGAGSFAEWTLYPALHLAPIALQALCDIDEARARNVASKFGTGRWYADHREMLAAEDLEALIICMGPRLRQPLVREALESGYHVFVPKPPAPSLGATLELAAVSERARRTLMVDFQRRFSFGVRRAKELMEEPGFGRLTQLSCAGCSGRYDEVRAAGYDGHVEAFLLDFAIHHLDLARAIGGEVAQLAVFYEEVDGASAFSVALEFLEGAVGTLQLTSQRIWWRNYDRVELTGQGAYITLDDLWKVKYYEGAQNTFTENYSDERIAELTGDGLALAEFVEAIRAERQPIASIHDGVETMRLYQAIYDAVREGRTGVIPLR